MTSFSGWLTAPDPDPRYSRLDNMDGLTDVPYQAAVSVRPISHRRRSTHIRSAVKWGEVVSMVVLFAVIALMSGIVAVVILGLAVR